MPEIPRFSSNVVAEPVPSRIGASQLVPTAGVEFGQQLQRSAGLLAQVEIRRHEALDQADASNLLVEAEIALENRQLELEESRDPRTHAQNMREQSQEVQREILAQAKNENVKQMIQPKLALLAGRQYIEARRKERTWTVEDSQASLMRYEDLLEQRIAKTTDQRDIDAIFKEMDEAWDERIPSLGAARVEAGKQAARRRMYEAIVRRDIRINPEKARADLEAGKYTDLEPKAKEQLIDIAEAEKARIDRDLRQQRTELQREANIKFERDLAANKLDLNEVLRNPYLDRQDMEFFRNAAKQTIEPKTNPATLIGILDMLDPKDTREETLESVRKAKREAQKAYLNGTLSKEDLLSTVKRSADVEKGDMFTSKWFQMIEFDVKTKLGWLGGLEGRFLSATEGGDGGSAFTQVMSQLMQEMEKNPNLRGKAAMDRANEISAPFAVNFGLRDNERLNPPPTKLAPDPADALPDASQHEGRIITNPKTGERRKSDGVRWVPVGARGT